MQPSRAQLVRDSACAPFAFTEKLSLEQLHQEQPAADDCLGAQEVAQRQPRRGTLKAWGFLSQEGPEK